jgi:hypothetical protein
VEIEKKKLLPVLSDAMQCALIRKGLDFGGAVRLDMESLKRNPTKICQALLEE